MRAVLHAFAVTGLDVSGRQGRRRYAEIVNSPILGELGQASVRLNAVARS
jgi:hypothetical protein